MTWNRTVKGLYLDSSGKMVTGTGCLKDEATGVWYYYSDGEKTTGWKYIDGNWYCFNYPGGSMGWSKVVDGYYLGYDGKMVTSEGWQQDDKENWYYVGSGEKVVTGWKYLEYDGEYSWYYFDNDGKMAHDTTIDGYYLDDSGKCQADGNGQMDTDDDYEEYKRLQEKRKCEKYCNEYYNMVSQSFGSGYIYGADVDFEYEHYLMVANSEGVTPVEFSDYVNIMGPVWEYKFEHTSTSEKLS